MGDTDWPPGKVVMNKQAEEQAQMAEELHSRIFASEPENEAVVETETETQPVQETEQEQVVDDELEELRKYKERYIALQGKFNAEVPSLHQELKEFTQAVFERLQAQATQEPEVDVPDEFASFKEAYGEDLYNAMRRLAALETEERIKASLQPVQEHVASVEDVQIKVAQQNFIEYMDSKVNGDWHSLWEGKDPKFVEFLQKPDPSGLYTYGELIKSYNDRWDADRMSIIFNTYLDSSRQKTQSRTESESMVAPNRTNAHTTPSISNPTIWTAQSMKEFQENDRLGKYTPEESKAMWDDLLSAPAQNRIR